MNRGETTNFKRLGGREYHCAVELTVQVVGGRWKPIILYHLGLAGSMRFSELKRSIPNITQKMLTSQLRELEADGVLKRKVHAQVPPRVDYSLTGLGRSVMPVLEKLCEWGGGFEKILLDRRG
ncbi:MAG: helix-turn-helix domain-containing protein [Desulfovibrionaceae bacterium]|nr:helix-turn-helix domain-containing protein [Desulfovibrionaceae bacterium]